MASWLILLKYMDEDGGKPILRESYAAIYRKYGKVWEIYGKYPPVIKGGNMKMSNRYSIHVATIYAFGLMNPISVMSIGKQQTPGLGMGNLT